MFYCKNKFEHHIDQLISNLLIPYFYYSKVFEIL
jgi:hypothetical protein